MIAGLGIDVVEIARIERAMRHPRFVLRILRPEERREGMTASELAGRWAAKEAVAKAVSCELGWHDVEVRRLPSGAPEARLTRPVAGYEGTRLHLSISHERGLAAAVAILERP